MHAQLTVEYLGHHDSYPTSSSKIGVFVESRLEDLRLQLVQGLALDDALSAVSVLQFRRGGADSSGLLAGFSPHHRRIVHPSAAASAPRDCW